MNGGKKGPAFSVTMGLFIERDAPFSLRGEKRLRALCCPRTLALPLGCQARSERGTRGAQRAGY